MAEHLKDGFNVVHCAPAAGNDYFLCGFAMDGEDGNGGANATRRRIDCPECIAIIRFCKMVRARELRATPGEGEPR